MKKIFVLFVLVLLFGCSGEVDETTQEVSEDEIIKVVPKAPVPEPVIEEVIDEDYEIFDVHEQIQMVTDAPKFLAAMDKAEVDKIVVLASPEATFNYVEGFVNHHINNEELMKMAQEYPNRFLIFPTIDPRLSGEFEQFKSYMDRGAAGLRLFSGQHAWFYRHIGPVNRPELDPILEYCQDNDIPVMYNMNPSKGTLQEEFEDVLARYPKLKVVCPHFCLSSIKSERFEYLMDTYPNLYTDISFGHFFEDGLRRISNDIPKFQRLFEKYDDRIMFGVDLVITHKTGTSSDWIYNLTKCYRDMLENEKYDCSVHIGKVFNVDMLGVNGLALNEEALKKVYHDNPKEWTGLE